MDLRAEEAAAAAEAGEAKRAADEAAAKRAADEAAAFKLGIPVGIYLKHKQTVHNLDSARKQMIYDDLVLKKMEAVANFDTPKVTSISNEIKKLTSHFTPSPSYLQLNSTDISEVKEMLSRQ